MQGPARVLAAVSALEMEDSLPSTSATVLQQLRFAPTHRPVAAVRPNAPPSLDRLRKWIDRSANGPSSVRRRERPLHQKAREHRVAPRTPCSGLAVLLTLPVD